MTKEKYEEIIKNLNLEKNKWQTLTEIESIVLNDGIGIYPNWVHMRFLLTDNEILIKHGSSVPYGSRLSCRFAISPNNMSLSFPPESVIVNSEFAVPFRKPKPGDILRATKGEKVLCECLVSKVMNVMNGFYIDLSNPLRFSNDARLSFYDPGMYSENDCIHGTEIEGIYLKFTENHGKEKKFGIQHESIKIKEIKEINLKLLRHNKTYKIQ